MFAYYGSKGVLSRYYPAPKYDVIIEPFAGSAKYSLLYWEKQVILYDINLSITTVWDYLINANPIDILDLPVLNVGSDLRNYKLLSYEEKLFLGFMIAASTEHPQNVVSPRTRWTHNSREKIAHNLYKIRHWKIGLSDFRKIPNEKATWFIDPPYQYGGEHYKHSFLPSTYLILKDLVYTWKGQKIVCENARASWLPFKPLVSNKGQSSNTIVEGIFVHESS